jgi:Fe2+ transport system protein B
MTVDVRGLARDLGVPVVAAAARSARGIPELLQNIAEVASGRAICRPRRVWTESKKLKASIDKLESMLRAEYPELPNARWVALRLLEGDQRITEAVQSGALTAAVRREPRENDHVQEVHS